MEQWKNRKMEEWNLNNGTGTMEQCSNGTMEQWNNTIEH